MAFKFLKSQLHLDHVRAHDPLSVQSYLLCKAHGALLIEDMISGWVSLTPQDHDDDYSINKFGV